MRERERREQKRDRMKGRARKTDKDRHVERAIDRDTCTRTKRIKRSR